MVGARLARRVKLTGTKYLNTAENIFAPIKGTSKTKGDKKGWDATTCGGGVWQHTGAQRARARRQGRHRQRAVPDPRGPALPRYREANQGYLADAKQEWAWFQNAGNVDHLAGSPTSMIHTILGGRPDLPQSRRPPTKCQVHTGTVYWTLRQGQFVAAMTGLDQATGNQSDLTQAETVANCVTSVGCAGDTSYAKPPLLDTRGILTEPCPGSPDNCKVAGDQDFLQYRGVFMRDLSCLSQVAGGSATVRSCRPRPARSTPTTRTRRPPSRPPRT